METLIDDRGRLLGVLNIVDAFVILLGVAVVTAGLAFVSDSPLVPLAAVVGGGLLFIAAVRYGSDSPPPTEPLTYQFECEVTELHPAVAAAISVGDTTRDGTLTIVDVHHEPTTVVVHTDAGELSEREHPQLRTATLTLEWKTAADTLCGERLYVGRSLSLVFEHVELEGMIVSIDDEAAASRSP